MPINPSYAHRMMPSGRREIRAKANTKATASTISKITSNIDPPMPALNTRPSNPTALRLSVDSNPVTAIDQVVADAEAPPDRRPERIGGGEQRPGRKGGVHGAGPVADRETPILNI